MTFILDAVNTFDTMKMARIQKKGLGSGMKNNSILPTCRWCVGCVSCNNWRLVFKHYIDDPQFQKTLDR